MWRLIFIILLFIPAVSFAVDIGQADIPYTISSGGTYELTENVTYAGGNAITINTSSAAVIRGKGGVAYSVTSTGGSAIYSSGGSYGDLEIYDLTINQGVGTGSYAGAVDLNSGTGTKSISIHDLDITLDLDAVSNDINGIVFEASATMTGAVYDNTITYTGYYSGTNRSTGICFLSGARGTSAGTPFEVYNNTINITGHLTNGIRTYGNDSGGGDYLSIHGNTITVDSSSDNTKSIQIDGGSDYAQVYSNTITINANNTSGNSYGIRLRYGADSANIYSNIIDASGGSGGSYPSHGIVVGGEQAASPNDPPTSIMVYSNNITTSNYGWGIATYGSIEASEIYLNTVSSGVGYPIGSTQGDGLLVDDLYFYNNTYTSSSSYAYSLYSTVTFSSIVICNDTWNSSTVVIGDVLDNSGTADITINNLVCGSAAPTITGFDLPATAASTTVSVNTFTATDNVGVTGYLLNQSATTPSASDPDWSGTAPTTVTVAGTGSQIVYAWAKDAADNISLSASDTVIVGDDTDPLTCSTDPTLCATEPDCTTAGWNWCDGVCQVAACPSPTTGRGLMIKAGQTTVSPGQTSITVQ